MADIRNSRPVVTNEKLRQISEAMSSGDWSGCPEFKDACITMKRICIPAKGPPRLIDGIETQNIIGNMRRYYGDPESIPIPILGKNVSMSSMMDASEFSKNRIATILARQSDPKVTIYADALLCNHIDMTKDDLHKIDRIVADSDSKPDKAQGIFIPVTGDIRLVDIGDNNDNVKPIINCLDHDSVSVPKICSESRIYVARGSRGKSSPNQRATKVVSDSHPGAELFGDAVIYRETGFDDDELMEIRALVETINVGGYTFHVIKDETTGNRNGRASQPNNNVQKAPGKKKKKGKKKPIAR